MPNRDRTGPEGEGPMTGWGAGDCAGHPTTKVAGPMPGRRFVGRRHAGPGGGRRWRHWFHATGLPRWARYGPAPSPEQETEALQARAEWLRENLDAIDQRLEPRKDRAALGQGFGLGCAGSFDGHLPLLTLPLKESLGDIFSGYFLIVDINFNELHRYPDSFSDRWT